MAIFLQYTDRKVIPNWRTFRATAALGELDSTKTTQNRVTIDISRQLRDWQLENSIGTAADLLSASFLTEDNTNEGILSASKYILDNKDQASISLIDLAERAITPSLRKDNFIDSISVDDLLSYSSQDATTQATEYIKKQIRHIKAKINSDPVNAIWWAELSRFYSIIGQNKQAIRSMEIAVNLSPNNRYILRSATRLFIHNDETDRAHYYLRKSPKTAVDPWLLSAHISTTSLLNKFQVNAKNAKAAIESNKFSYFNLTELSSAIGTLEFEAGAIKDSKKFFEIAKKAPNDNSLAQLEWIAQKDSRFTFEELNFNSISNSYEALAFDNFEKEKWEESTINSIKWFLDIPYSSRPVILGSFVFSAYLDDNESAIKLCKLGLVANPHDITILNNLMYAYLLANNIEEAKRVDILLSNCLSRDSDISDEKVIMLQATSGLKAFREGNIEEGKWLYQLAIKNSQAKNRKDLELMACVNFLRELILNNCPEVEGEYYRMSTIEDKQVQNHILRLKEKVMKLYQNTKKS